jgi:Lipocalin-like domain
MVHALLSLVTTRTGSSSSLPTATTLLRFIAQTAQKFSSDDRAKGSAEEFRDASLSMSVHFGHYTVDPAKHTISFQIDRASWPNWDDTVQVRRYELKGDELSWKVARRPDGSIPITVLRRVSAGDQPKLTCSTSSEKHSKEGKTRDPDY